MPTQRNKAQSSSSRGSTSLSASRPAVTIYEIAQHVGVSPAAVSSVLSNRQVERRIGENTVRRIREAVEELGYVPNMAGRRLRAQASSVRQFDLAILTSYEAPLPLVGQALRALQIEVDAHTTKDTRYAVSIEMFHAGRISEKPGLLSADRYHGVIITNTLPEDDRFLAGVKLPCVTVVLGRRIAGYSCVLEAPDFVGRHSAELLLDAGCKKLAVIHGKSLTQATANRVTAFREKVRARAKSGPASIVCAGLSASDALDALQATLTKGRGCDGLFAVTDSLAVGAYQFFRQQGLRIPDDVAVVGVGDYELAGFFNPPLTTTAGANDAMVAEAVPLLFSQLLDRKKTQPQEILVAPPVYVRDSTRRKG